jgi:hypothetical protein
MINFHPHITEQLNKRLGQRTVLLLEVDWVDGGTITYSDVDFPGADPFLISVGTISRRVDGQANSSINVVLDAANETVVSIFRSLDIHMRPARLYLGFPDVVERALLFEGLINSQVTFGEQDRTLQFEVLTKLEDALVGFSMEDGYFPLVAPEDRAKVWPLPFGTVCHYPTQRLTTTIKGFLVEGQGVPDPTLVNRICQIEKTQCPTVQEPSIFGFVTRPSPECLARKRNEGCILKDLLARQQATAQGIIEVAGGEAFPQNKVIKVRVGTVVYKGIMVGNQFTITQTTHPDANNVAQCKNVAPLSYGFRNKIGDETEANKCSNHGASASVNGTYDNRPDCFTAGNASRSNFVTVCGQNPGGATAQNGLVGGSTDSWAYYDSMPTGRYIFLPAGTEVILSEYDDDLVYMASLVPGIVTQVVAYRQFGDLSVLTQLPTDWYSVVNVDYGGYQAVEVRLNQLPSASSEPGWSDDIYVSFVSSVGPNPVAVIQWLIENYTDFSVDSSNFSSISSAMTNFPVNFVLTSRPNVFSLIKDICYQSRLAIRFVDGVASLVQLSAEPTSVRTLTTDDVVLGSLTVSYTATEDLATNHTISWRAQQVPQISGRDIDQKFVMRFNIPKYGSSLLEQNWYTQNTFDSLYKAATFWLIRKANTWHQLTFTTSVKHLDLDVLDCVTINIGDQFPTTKIVLTEKTYNSDTNTITWSAWTPIRAGESSPYLWAWPSGVTSGRFPLPSEDSFIGDGSGKVVIPPVGHPLRLGFVSGESLPVSSGDPFPSDVGFVSTPVYCQVPLGNEVKFSDTPIIDALAKSSFQGKIADQQAAQAGGDTNIQREKKGCAFAGLNPCPFDLLPAGSESTAPPKGDDGEDIPSCTYEVSLNYIVPFLIGVNCGGPCSTLRQNGLPCSGSFITIKSVVNSYDAAVAAVAAHNALKDAYACNANSGVPQPYAGTTIRAYATNGTVFTNSKPTGGVCPDVDAGIQEQYSQYQSQLNSADQLQAPDEWLQNTLPNFDPLNPGETAGLA